MAIDWIECMRLTPRYDTCRHSSIEARVYQNVTDDLQLSVASYALSSFSPSKTGPSTVSLAQRRIQSFLGKDALTSVDHQPPLFHERGRLSDAVRDRIEKATEGGF